MCGCADENPAVFPYGTSLFNSFVNDKNKEKYADVRNIKLLQSIKYVFKLFSLFVFLFPTHIKQISP